MLRGMEPARNYAYGQSGTAKVPHLGAYLILALPPDGEGPRTFQCFECDLPDPMKTEEVAGWLKGELHPPR